MADALEKQPDTLKKYINQAVNNDEHSFIAFNTAWFTDGLFIHIGTKQVLEKPVQILHLAHSRWCFDHHAHCHYCWWNGEAKVIETFVGLDNAYLSAAVTEVFVCANADVTLYKMQCESEKSLSFWRDLR